MADEGLRGEIHIALDAIDRPAPHLPHLVARAIHEHAQGQRHQHLRRWIVVTAVLLLGPLTVLAVIRLSTAQMNRAVPASQLTLPQETAPWAENLTFTGAINTEIHATLPDSGATVNTCASSARTTAGDFDVTLYLPVGDGSSMQMGLLVQHYRGPGTYRDTAVRIYIQYPQADIASWANVAEDRATLTVNPDERSGVVDARLSAFRPGAAPVTVTGNWSCHAT